MEMQIVLLIQIKGNLLKKSATICMKDIAERRSSLSVFWSIWLTHTEPGGGKEQQLCIHCLSIQQDKTNWSWAFALRQLNPLALHVFPRFYSTMSSLVILILSDPSKWGNLIVLWLQ